jgi:two-component system response regulator YesN
MLKVIIADDEPEVINLCKMLITVTDVTIIGEAKNGMDLYDKIKTLEPDAVITDICMPQMNGLELISKARRDFPDVRFIVMSGFTEFDYAREALKFGVWDYLLKPLKKEELNQTLANLNSELLRKKTLQQSLSATEDQLKESLTLLREQSLREIIDKVKDGTETNELGDSVFCFDMRLVQCVIINLDSCFFIKSVSSTQIPRTLEATCKEILEESRKTAEETTLVRKESEAYMIFFFSQDKETQLSSKKLLSAIENIIQHSNIRNTFCHITAAASEIFKAAPNTLEKAVLQARSAITWRLEKKEAFIYYDNETEKKEYLHYVPEITKAENHLSEAIVRLNTNAICEDLTLIFESVSKDAGSLYKQTERLLSVINAALKSLPSFSLIDDLKTIEQYQLIYGMYDPKCLAKQLTDYAISIIDTYKDLMMNAKASVVLQAEQYITENYASGITLKEVADHVGLNPNYFSSLFKAETGKGFLVYLQHIRTENAKRLLRETNHKIEVIAKEVGYYDVKSFTKVFQRETGVTPMRYRKHSV